MRLAIFILILGALLIYAWKDWFIPLCALIVMTALMKHESIPRNVLGIQGANPWNLLFLFVLLGWAADRFRRRDKAGLPTAVVLAVAGYVLVIVVAFLRGVIDVDSVRVASEEEAPLTTLGFVSEYFINPLKYLGVAALLFDGARTRRNMVLGLGAVVLQPLLYALQVVRHVPLSVLFIAGESPFRYRIGRDCGLHANDMALVQVIGFWSAVACLSLWPRLRGWLRWALVGGAGVMLLALALCNSRGGFLAFLVIAVGLGVIRWRWMLAAMPVALIALCVAFPSIPTRLAVGVGVADVSGSEGEDWDAISAGRTTYLWPPSMDEIAASPVVGQGRLTILRTSLYERIVDLNGMCPTHPHNAYIEMMLDSGVVGLALTLAFYLLFPCLGLSVGRSAAPLLRTVATMGLAGGAAILVMGLSGQTFFPREGIFVVLCTYGLLLRAYVAHRASVPVGVRARQSVRAPLPAHVGA